MTEICQWCGMDIHSDDYDTWIDDTEGDVCCAAGGNDPHVPAPDEPPDMSGASDYEYDGESYR